MFGTEGGPHWAPYVTVSMELVNACNFLRNKDIWKRTSPLCSSSNSSPKTCIILPPSYLNVRPESNMAAYKMAAVKFTPPNDFALGLIRSHMVVIHLFLKLCDLQRMVRDLCPTCMWDQVSHPYTTDKLSTLHHFQEKSHCGVHWPPAHSTLDFFSSPRTLCISQNVNSRHLLLSHHEVTARQSEYVNFGHFLYPL